MKKKKSDVALLVLLNTVIWAGYFLGVYCLTDDLWFRRMMAVCSVFAWTGFTVLIFAIFWPFKKGSRMQRLLGD
jgi:hypothetical protein